LVRGETDLGTALAYWTDPEDPEELQEVRSAPTTLPGTLTRAQLIERYAVATGRDPSDMTFYLAFARFKVAVIIQQIYYRYIQRLTQDARFASCRKESTLCCAPRGIARKTARYERGILGHSRI
jgi:aminoglycoside phosphotransferase (APT) family kinase protein